MLVTIVGWAGSLLLAPEDEGVRPCNHGNFILQRGRGQSTQLLPHIHK